MIVVDTNVIAYLHISGEHSEKAQQLLHQTTDWHTPLLWKSEFRNILAQYIRRSLLSLSDALSILEAAEQLVKGREYAVSSPLVMELVEQSQCSAYDCEFVALARTLNVPLVTSDKQILRNFPDTTISLATFVA